MLYNTEYFKNYKNKLLKINTLISYDNDDFILAELISQNRIKLIADMWDWRNSIISEEFSISFGSRIHGNIMALLSGVPALIVPLDIRVREMAEFYEIPHISVEKIKDKDKIDLFELFEKLDYSQFNNSFKNKYDNFEKFLVKYGIIENKMNSDNQFFKNENSNYKQYINEESIKLANFVLKHKSLCKLIKRLKK